MSFGHITIHWAKISEIATLTEFAIESTEKRSKIHLRSLLLIWQKPDKCLFHYQVWHPRKCLDKVKGIPVLTHRGNLTQIQHLPPLPLVQNYGKFDPKSIGKMEQY